MLWHAGAVAPDDASAQASRGGETGDHVDVDAAVAVLFAGPPDDFVAGRDALVRSLRTAKRRDEATEVKALRKPKAVARALNAANLQAPDTVDDLAAAVAAVNAAQDGEGDVRAALGALRDAERRVTEAALAATAGGDRAVDASSVGSAVRAVLADPDALATLRRGRLVDVPTGGGFGSAGFGGGLGAPAETTEEAEAGADEAAGGGRPRSGAPAGRRPSGRAARPPARPDRDAARDVGRVARDGAGRSGATVSEAAGRSSGGAAAPTEPRPVAAARRAVAEAEEALRLATEAVGEGAPEVEAAEQAEAAARDEADAAARAAEDARERALAAARVATTARREAAARARRRDQADADLAKARARLAKLDPT